VGGGHRHKRKHQLQTLWTCREMESVMGYWPKTPMLCLGGGGMGPNWGGGSENWQAGRGERGGCRGSRGYIVLGKKPRMEW